MGSYWTVDLLNGVPASTGVPARKRHIKVRSSKEEALSPGTRNLVFDFVLSQMSSDVFHRRLILKSCFETFDVDPPVYRGRRTKTFISKQLYAGVSGDEILR